LPSCPPDRTRCAATRSKAATTSTPSAHGGWTCSSAPRTSSTPIPFDTEAARIYGRVTAAVITAGRKPRRRIADLMIASIAIAEDLPLYTTDPDDFAGLGQLLTLAPVTRPRVPHER
jgi:hypothetical protein